MWQFVRNYYAFFFVKFQWIRRYLTIIVLMIHFEFMFVFIYQNIWLYLNALLLHHHNVKDWISTAIPVMALSTMPRNREEARDSKSSAGESVMLPVTFWGAWGSAYPPSTPAGLYGQAGGTVKRPSLSVVSCRHGNKLYKRKKHNKNEPIYFWDPG